MGTITLEDPETGRQLEVETTPKLREQFAKAAAAHRAKVATDITATGAAHLVVSTERDWLSDLLHFLERRRRRRR